MSELELLLALALDHKTCTTENARIDGDAVLIPFDVQRGSEWRIEHERVRTRTELLEALGY